MSRLEHFGTDLPITHFGVNVVGPSEERHLRKFHESSTSSSVQRLPMSQIRAGQSFVDQTKGYQRDTSKDQHPVGTQLPNGDVMLDDGHHRLVDAKKRGDTHFEVNVAMKYGRCYTPSCEWGYHS